MGETFQIFDAAAEEAWVEEQRTKAAEYLAKQGVQHGEIGEWPAWHVQPWIAILAIESGVSPGRMGWWVITGDCPTDYVSFNDAAHPREAVQLFGRRWKEASEYMLRGEPHPSITIGDRSRWPELGALLRARARSLADAAEEDSIWEGDEE